MKQAPVVLKFGGTSVEDAAAMRRVAGIALDRRPETPLLVVSAMAGVTDRLVRLCGLALAAEQEPADQLIAELRQRHLDTLAKLADDASSSISAATSVATSGATSTATSAAIGTAAEAARGHLENLFSELRSLVRGVAAVGELTDRTRDAVLAFGERLSPILVQVALVAAGLPAAWVDARRVIVTDERHTRALPLLEQTKLHVEERVLPLLAEGTTVVLGGFIAATAQGVTSTLGRGGSDYSASILGACLQARRVEIWTDVDGMLTADPRLCPDAQRIRVISFQEAAELAYFGAKVLHPSTLLPAMQKNIPVWVLNSRAPLPGPPDGEKTGTLITSRPPHSNSPFKCISSKRRIAVIDIVSTRMLMAHGFLKAIWEVFDRYRCSVDMVSTSEVSVSLTISEFEHLPAIADELGRFAEVRYEGRKAILCLVGENIRNRPGLAAEVFAALGDINIRMISQGASEINIGMVIDDDDVPRAIARLHSRFFSAWQGC